VYIDGPTHTGSVQAALDREVREALAGLGYRVVGVRADRPFAEQVKAYPRVLESVS
jgi:hypothetical protein